MAKFNNAFTHELGVETKSSLYKYFIQAGVAQTAGVIKNRQDLFDPFFENGRKEWWQKGGSKLTFTEAFIQTKQLSFHSQSLRVVSSKLSHLVRSPALELNLGA